MPGEITVQDAQYTLDIIKKIYAKVGPGLPATHHERQQGEILKQYVLKLTHEWIRSNRA